MKVPASASVAGLSSLEAWVLEWMRRDLDQSSVFLADEPSVRVHARPFVRVELAPDWQSHALDAMTVNLQQRGWNVSRVDMYATALDVCDDFLAAGVAVAGVLQARRYGHEAAIVVQIDDWGEIYGRIAHPSDVTGPVLRQQEADGPGHGGMAEECADRCGLDLSTGSSFACHRATEYWALRNAEAGR